MGGADVTFHTLCLEPDVYSFIFMSLIWGLIAEKVVDLDGGAPLKFNQTEKTVISVKIIIKENSLKANCYLHHVILIRVII